MSSNKLLQKIILDLQAAERELSLRGVEISDTKVETDLLPYGAAALPTVRNDGNNLIDARPTQTIEPEKSTHVPSSGSSAIATERLKSENQRLLTQLSDAISDRNKHITANNSLRMENELLLEQLHKIQEELELYYIDKMALEAALEQTQFVFESARLYTCQSNEDK
jgi:chaperonin cofactor prefoldin